MKIKRYPLGKDQLAQIDCRKDDCIFQERGQCHNISPAITLNPSGTVVCWSEETEKTIKENEA